MKMKFVDPSGYFGFLKSQYMGHNKNFNRNLIYFYKNDILCNISSKYW